MRAIAPHYRLPNSLLYLEFQRHDPTQGGTRPAGFLIQQKAGLAVPGHDLRMSIDDTGIAPLKKFADWLAEARRSEPDDAEAMALATSDRDSGMPSVRMVLLKSVGDDGFVFYTNLGSQKAQELQGNPQAALCFHWKSLHRQVRVQGQVTPVSDAEADAYFQSRARDSRIGAWASRQSRPMQGRFELEKRVGLMALRFGLGQVPRPPFWSGFRLQPQRIEFWQAKPFRLHDRQLYTRDDKGQWTTSQLFP